MSIEIDGLEMQMLRAMQDGDVETGRLLTDEVRRLRTENAALQARADPDVDNHPMVIAKAALGDALNWFRWNKPAMYVDDDARAEVVAEHDRLQALHPQASPLQVIVTAADNVERRRGDPKTRADHESIEQMRAARAMGGRAANIELQATSGDDFDGDDGESSDEDGQRKLDNAEYFAKRRASQMPRNPGSSTFDWSQGNE